MNLIKGYLTKPFDKLSMTDSKRQVVIARRSDEAIFLLVITIKITS